MIPEGEGVRDGASADRLETPIPGQGVRGVGEV